MSFGYWSVNQFNQVFDTLSHTLSATSVANVSAVSSLLKKDAEVASTSPEVFTNAFATSTDSEVSFTLLHKDIGLYIGCTYPISWQASTTIRSLETTLVDAGTRKPTGPIASGLAKENNIETDSQNLKWKVGIVWPGKYFIEISSVNGIATDEISQRFIINEMPDGINAEDKKNLCDTTGGSL